MACSDRFSLCSSSWVVSLFQWLRLWFLRVPKFIQLSWLFHTVPKTSKSQNRKQSLFASSWIPWCVADARPGNISNVFNPPSCTHSWVTKAWLFCCYRVLWSPPFYSHTLLCFHHLLPGLCEESVNFSPCFQPLFSNLRLPKQTWIGCMPT